MKSYQITLYTKEDCVYCDKSKEWLQEAGLEFHEIKIGTDIEREAVRKMFPDQRTAPIVVVSFVGGSELAWKTAVEEEENKIHRKKENKYAKATH